MLLGHLLFGPAVLLFHHTILEYLRAPNANEARPTHLGSLRSQATDLVRLAVDLAGLHLLVCSRAPTIRNLGTQLCFRNPPLSYGLRHIPSPPPVGHIKLLCIYPRGNVDLTVDGLWENLSCLSVGPPIMSSYSRSNRT